MTSLESINFGKYTELYHNLKVPNLNFRSINRLDFSNNTYTDSPPYKALELLPNLHILILSNNSITKFDVAGLVRGAPNLQELDLSNNNIGEFDDIVELGNLKHLEKLNLNGNPIVPRFIRIKFIEFLLFPNKYKPYNAMGILTATYNSVPNKAKLDDKTQETYKNFNRFLEKDEQELELKSANFSRVTKYDHKATLIKLAKQTCPVPRKTRFPMLNILNEEIISIKEMQSILMTEDLTHIMAKKDETEELRVLRPNEKIHKHHLERYIKKKKWEKDFAKQVKMDITEKAEDAADQVLMLDTIENHITINGYVKKPFDHQEVIWKKPVDLQYKDAEFNIGITEYKKMVKDYDDERKKEKEDMEGVGKGLHEKGQKAKDYDMYDDDTFGMDKETKLLFRGSKKREKILRKLKKGDGYTVEQATSDSEVSELQGEDEKEGWDEEDFMFDEKRSEVMSANLYSSASPRSFRKLTIKLNLHQSSDKGDDKEAEGVENVVEPQALDNNVVLKSSERTQKSKLEDIQNVSRKGSI